MVERGVHREEGERMEREEGRGKKLELVEDKRAQAKRPNSLDSEHRVVVQVLGIARENLSDKGLVSRSLNVELY